MLLARSKLVLLEAGEAFSGLSELGEDLGLFELALLQLLLQRELVGLDRALLTHKLVLEPLNARLQLARVATLELLLKLGLVGVELGLGHLEFLLLCLGGLLGPVELVAQDKQLLVDLNTVSTKGTYLGRAPLKCARRAAQTS